MLNRFRSTLARHRAAADLLSRRSARRPASHRGPTRRIPPSPSAPRPRTFPSPGIDDKLHKLADYKDPILVVMFICDHCPTSQLYEGRMKKLVEDYRTKGVGFVAINPNDPKAVTLSELGYTDVTDSLEDMKIRAEYSHFNFPYLYDGETQEVTQAYGAQATPHIFIFDKERKLQYEGRIDNAQRESLVKIQDARLALDAMLAGKAVAVPHTPSFGCSTKWKSKIDMWSGRHLTGRSGDHGQGAGARQLRACSIGFDHGDRRDAGHLPSGIGRDDLVRPELERGLEADQCYVFDPAKLTVVNELLARRERTTSRLSQPRPRRGGRPLASPGGPAGHLRGALGTRGSRGSTAKS